MSDLTHKEFSKKGGEATSTKYPKELRSTWAKKGPEALKSKYGPDYFKVIAQKSVTARKLKKEQAQKLK